MLLYITVTVAVLALGWFVNSMYRKNINIATAVNDGTAGVSRQGYVNRICLTAILSILFALSALRVGTGNDYWVYRTGFLQINGGETPVSYELGFKGLVLLMQKIFYRDCYKEIFALFAFLIALFLVKGLYDVSDWFFYTLFLCMANGFYFMSFSNVRYYFAFALCMCAIRPLLDKKYVQFLIWIVVAAFFHKTALLCIPVYLVAYFLKWSKKTVWLIPAASACLLIGRVVIKFVIHIFYPFYDLDEAGDISYINILKCLAILIFALIYYKETIKDNAKAEMMFNLNLFALLLYAFASYIPELSRICYYMVMGQIFLIPHILMNIKNKKWRVFFTIAISLAFTAYFIMFLIKGADQAGGIRILPYMSWLFG